MSEQRRGFAVLIRGGDAQISGALARGMMGQGADSRGGVAPPAGATGGPGDGGPHPALRATFPTGTAAAGTSSVSACGAATFPTGTAAAGTSSVSACGAATFPIGEGSGGPRDTDAERARVVKDEIIRQRAREAARRAAMRRHTPEEWEAMTAQARYFYGQDPEPSRLSRALLGLWALLCYGMSRAYRAQALVLESPEGRRQA